MANAKVLVVRLLESATEASGWGQLNFNFDDLKVSLC